MDGRKIIIHYNEKSELFDIEDFNTTTVHSLLRCAQQRFYRDGVDLLADLFDFLCDGPYASKPIDDVRLRSIDEMLQQLMPPSSDDERSDIVQQPIHLWLCNCNKLIFVLLTHLVIVYNFLLDGNNGFLFNDTFTTYEQHPSRETITVEMDIISEHQAPQPINMGEKVLFPFYLVV
jgi:hypothetical protein